MSRLYMKKLLHTIWEIAEVLCIAGIAVMAIKFFLIQPFIVNGASMEPTFFDGNYLIVDELSYQLKEPARGDVVVFRAPKNESVYYIKRIVGLPGERVEIVNDMVTIFNNEHQNGFNLDEKYLNGHTKTGWTGNIVVTLKDNQYFVLGDNRMNSLDSRYWGPLEKKEIIGLVRLRLWPLNEIDIFNGETYAY